MVSDIFNTVFSDLTMWFFIIKELVN